MGRVTIDLAGHRLTVERGQWSGDDPDLVVLAATPRPGLYHPDPDYGAARAAADALGAEIVAADSSGWTWLNKDHAGRVY